MKGAKRVLSFFVWIFSRLWYNHFGRPKETMEIDGEKANAFQHKGEEIKYTGLRSLLKEKTKSIKRLQSYLANFGMRLEKCASDPYQSIGGSSCCIKTA
jgi:hypothetical protein